MAKSVQQLWTKWSSKEAAAGMPPDKASIKIRDKHVTESIPYNTKHATEHIDSNVNNLKKLKLTNPDLASVLATRSIKALHSAEQKLTKFER